MTRIRDWLGHRSVTTTEYYQAKIAASVLHASRHKLEDVWRGVAPNLGELYIRLRNIRLRTKVKRRG
ncbi:MAG: hypothetical protein AAF355_11650 [Myxococcota bacterium]